MDYPAVWELCPKFDGVDTAAQQAGSDFTQWTRFWSPHRLNYCIKTQGRNKTIKVSARGEKACPSEKLK